MPQKKMKKAVKPKKKLLSPIDEDDAVLAAKEANADDDEQTVEREPGIEEIAKMTTEVVAATDDDLDDLDLPTVFEPPESEN